MADDRNSTGRRPLAGSEMIDEAAEGSEPDVEVFSIPDTDTDPEAITEVPAPRKQKWIDELRTSVWEGRDGLPGPEPVRQTGRTAAARQSARPLHQVVRRSRPGPEAAHARAGTGRALRQSRQLQAPARIKIKPVARISPDPRLWLMTRPDTVQAEQFRVLALKLREERGARVVAVASPTREGEGHLAAANLALAFAEGGRTRTVLVDADLRGSQIAELFELQEGPGAAEQLRAHRRQSNHDWVTLGLSSSLHLLPSGAPAKNPASLLGSESMEELVLELRRYFDFIVVSAPPVLDTADVNILQEHVDGVLLVVRAGTTRRDSVAASVSRLGQGRLLGAVLVDGR